MEPGWVVGTDYITPNGMPRSLKDQTAVNLAAELTGLPVDAYYHVIITTDAVHPAASLVEDRRPVILVRSGETIVSRAWELFLPRLLHCNWDQLSNLASGWQNSLFITNYRFFGSRLHMVVSGGR